MVKTVYMISQSSKDNHCLNDKTIKRLDFSKYSRINKKISTLLYRSKDVFGTVSTINLECNRVNLITKIYAKIYNEYLTFLISPGYSNRTRLFEIVAGCLSSCSRSVTHKEEWDSTYIQYLSAFLQNNQTVTVHLENNVITLRNTSRCMFLCELDNVDDASQQSLARSICILLAMCGKVVSNNIDDVILNDYGIVNSFEEVKDVAEEDVQRI